MTIKSLKLFILALTTALLSLSDLQVLADPVSVNPRPRMLSMGGAGVATLGDKDSAMMNPASLNDVKESRIEVLPILIEIPFSITTMTDYLDFQEALDREGATNATKRAAMQEFLSDVGSSALGTRVNIYPSWTRKNFHIGVMADIYVNPRFRLGGVMADQVVELGGSSGTLGLIVGGSYAFLGGALQVGASLKPLYRMPITKEQAQTTYDFIKGRDPGTNIEDEILGSTLLDKKAFGIGGDLGIKYFVPYFTQFKPTIGVTLQDVGNTRFFAGDKLAQIEQSLSAGIALHYDWSFTRNTFAVDFRNMLEKQDFENKVHFGAESVLWNMLAVRAGMSQLYWTAGLGLETKFFEFDLYLAAKEAGDRAHIQEERVLGTRIAFAL